MPLPAEWVEKLFARLQAIYGTRFLSQYRHTDLGEVHATWAEALAGFVDQPERIAQALTDCLSREDPPNLPQFLALCRGAPAPGVQQTMLPPASADKAVGRRRLAELVALIGPKGFRAEDPMFWAKRPKGERAVALLVQGAQRSYPLRLILRRHLSDGGIQCRSPEATAAIERLSQSPPAWLESDELDAA